MTEQPNVGFGLLCIHHMITRGMDVGLEKSLYHAEHGFSNASLKEGFVKYVGAFAALLNAHHITEDDLAFPYLRKLIPGAPVHELETEHKVIEDLLPRVRAAVSEIETNDHPQQALRDLHETLAKLKEAWHPHIRKEEEHFSVELLGRLIPAEEHIRLIKEFSTHSQKIAQPDYLVVPFMLYNLEPKERAVFSAAFPPIVTEQLVPVVWKEKWQAMSPYLLS